MLFENLEKAFRILWKLISSRLRRREGPIRTMSLLEAKIKIPVGQTMAVYQKLAPKIKQMKALGMSYREIAASLGIDKKTVGRGLGFGAT